MALVKCILNNHEVEYNDKELWKVCFTIVST